MPTFLFINVPKVYSNYNNRTAIQMLLNKEGVGWSKQCILKMSTLVGASHFNFRQCPCFICYFKTIMLM